MRGKEGISVIIITYNQAPNLDLILSALAAPGAAPARREIVIVDDGSEDATGEVVAKYAREVAVKYIKMPHVGNRGRLRNLGAAEASLDRLLFLDGDMIVDPGCLSAHLAATDGDADRVSIGLRRNLFSFDRDWIDAGTVRNHFELIRDYPYWGDDREWVMEYGKRSGAPLAAPWILLYSCNFCLRRDRFLAAGGFDEEFSRKWGVEDVELGYRLWKTGSDLRLNMEAVAYHINHPSNYLRHYPGMMENMALFFRKFPCFDVELYTFYHRLLTQQFHAVRSAVLSGAGRTVLEEDAAASVLGALGPDAISFGVVGSAVEACAKVVRLYDPCAQPAAGGPQPAEGGPQPDGGRRVALLGLRTLEEGRRYGTCLVSAKYGEVNPCLLELLLEEGRRIADRVVLVDGRKGAVAPPPRKPRALFLLGRYVEHLAPYSKYFFTRLALALDAAGVEVSMGRRYDPLDDLPRHSGFLRLGSAGERARLDALFDRKMGLLLDRVPCIIDHQDMQENLIPTGNRLLWEEIRFRNFELGFKVRQAAYFDVLLCRRPADKARMGDAKPTLPLPVGVTGRERDVRPRRPRGPMRILWVSPVADGVSNPRALLEAFRAAFPGGEDVTLTVLHGADFCPKMESVDRSDPCCHGSVFGFFREVERLTRLKQVACLEDALGPSRDDPRVRVVSEDPTEEELRERLAATDCLVHTDGSLGLSPVVLEWVAMGRKPILTASGAFEGYLDGRHALFAESVARSAVAVEPFPEMPEPGDRGLHRYGVMDVVSAEALAERLREAYRDPEALRVEEEDRRAFVAEFHWDAIAERFARHLELAG